MKSEIKRKLKILGFALAVVVTFPFVIGTVIDFCDYQSIMEGTYTTPWYDDTGIKQPYTRFRLSQYPTTYRVTTNGDSSQMWIVKEKHVGDKTFWTVDYKLNLNTQ